MVRLPSYGTIWVPVVIPLPPRIIPPEVQILSPDTLFRPRRVAAHPMYPPQRKEAAILTTNLPIRAKVGCAVVRCGALAARCSVETSVQLHDIVVIAQHVVNTRVQEFFPG